MMVNSWVVHISRTLLEFGLLMFCLLSHMERVWYLSRISLLTSEQEIKVKRNSPEKSVSHRRSNSSLRSTSPDIDSKDFKNIYVDTCKPIPSTKLRSLILQKYPNQRKLRL